MTTGSIVVLTETIVVFSLYNVKNNNDFVNNSFNTALSRMIRVLFIYFNNIIIKC